MFLLLLKMRTVGLWAWVWVNIQQQISWVSKETFLELLTSCNFCGKYLEIYSRRHQRNSSQQQQLIFSKSLLMGGGSDPQKHHRYVNWKNGRVEETRIIFDCDYSRMHYAFFLYNEELQRNDVNAAFSCVKRTNTGLTMLGDKLKVFACSCSITDIVVSTCWPEEEEYSTAMSWRIIKYVVWVMGKSSEPSSVSFCLWQCYLCLYRHVSPDWFTQAAPAVLPPRVQTWCLPLGLERAGASSPTSSEWRPTGICHHGHEPSCRGRTRPLRSSKKSPLVSGCHL